MIDILQARDTYGQSLDCVATRDELPVVLNSRGLFGCGVEVGVREGGYSELILRHWKGMHLISVDPWQEDLTGRYLDVANVGQAEHEACYRNCCERLAPFGRRSSIWRMTSVEASERVPHHTLDFVYLDARHDFEAVTEDLHAWYDRIRPGGLFCGHDFLDGELPEGKFGVKSAVTRFCGEHGLTVHTTHLDGPWITWMAEIPLPSGEVQPPPMRQE